eukprot:gene6621-9088_t
MDDKVKITFDKEYKLRVLDPVKFERGEELEKECSTFVEKISSFNTKINSLVDVLDSHANRIDGQKLRAIGLRIAAENEVEQRVRQQRALQTMINEKKAELDRYTTQLQSLERIESEQKVLLEKITNS